MLVIIAEARDFKTLDSHVKQGCPLGGLSKLSRPQNDCQKITDTLEGGHKFTLERADFQKILLTCFLKSRSLWRVTVQETNIWGNLTLQSLLKKADYYALVHSYISGKPKVFYVL